MTRTTSAFGEVSGDDFARIDLVSNHTVFTTPDYYRALVQGKDLPIETFSSFIHEATHHWCFISPVGNALALLYLSASKKALHWLVTGDEVQTQEALNDLFVYESALRWLRPLNEGLAQFAEYDVLPAEAGSLISPPLLSTLTHLFNLPRRLASAKLDDSTSVLYQLTDDINRWRLSRRTIERKSELLLQPIGTAGDPYLLGYLTVKQLWRNASRFYEELRNSDIFLMFIRKLVFGDYSLVAEILDRKQTPEQRCMKFGQRLYERLYAIRLMLFDEDVPWSEWEKILASPSADKIAGTLHAADSFTFASLDTQKRVKKGFKLNSKLMREVCAPIETKSKSADLPFPPDYFFNVLRERHLMWLGDMSAKWQSTGQQVGRVFAGDEILFENFKLTSASDEGLNDLRLDIYIDLYANYQLTTLGNHRGVFGFASRQQISKEIQSDLLQKRLDRQQIVKLTDLLHDLMEANLIGTNYHELINDFWAKGPLDLLTQIYLGFAFDYNEQVNLTVTQKGIAEVLQNDGDLIRNVSAITLATSAGMTPEGLLASCADLPLDPLGTVRKVTELWPLADFPLASIDSDGFLYSVF